MRLLTEDDASNKLSFVKDGDWSINDFELSFSKTVGEEELTISSLQDEYSLATCTPFIVLPVDLSVNDLSSGEYTVDLKYQSDIQETVLVEVRPVEPTADGSDDVYGSVIVL